MGNIVNNIGKVAYSNKQLILFLFHLIILSYNTNCGYFFIFQAQKFWELYTCWHQDEKYQEKLAFRFEMLYLCIWKQNFQNSFLILFAPRRKVF